LVKLLFGGRQVQAVVRRSRFEMGQAAQTNALRAATPFCLAARSLAFSLLAQAITLVFVRRSPASTAT